MNEKYVTSLELSQRLKDAGFPQSTAFAWADDTKVDQGTYFADLDRHVLIMERGMINILSDGYTPVAAPMTDELLEQLPDKVNGKYVKVEIRNLGTHTFMPMLVEERLDRAKSAEYHPDFNDLGLSDDSTIDTRPNALAELWLWCKDTGHVLEAQS